MDITSVCILGGSGFVGRSVAEQLCGRGLRVRVITRSRPRAMAVAVLPTAEIEVADPHDPASLARAFDGMDAVVNLVGILHESGRRTFEACHVELPRYVATAARKAGVLQVLHMSALGASAQGPSDYQRSKAAGEAALREAAGPLPVTIFRPSVIFGEGDAFLNLFARFLRIAPVFPVARPDARFQPIWVEDVARCFADSLGNRRAFGATYELGGPKVYSLRELLEFVATTLGKKRRVVGLPAPIASMQAFALEHLPGKLMTRDNLRSMEVDNVCAGPFPEAFGFRPASMEAIVQEYLSADVARARYPRYRNYAGR
jgi:NADH dehydrogenase